MGGSSAGSSGSADAPTTTRSTVTQVREKKSILDYSPTVQLVKGVYNAVKGSMEKSKSRKEANVEMGLGTDRMSNYNTSGGDGGNDNPIPVATNVGGTIVTAPSSAEVSQSKATDVTYDSRKTKAKGRSMTILTSSRGVRNNTNAVLGTKSLLGRA